MTSSSALQGLPDKIKLNICLNFGLDGSNAWANLHSLTALRLTRRAFAFVPAEKIFEIIKIYPSSKWLRSLESVAVHTQYSLRMKKLEANSAYLAPLQWFLGLARDCECIPTSSDFRVI
jgi:hypothetical protein